MWKDGVETKFRSMLFTTVNMQDHLIQSLGQRVGQHNLRTVRHSDFSFFVMALCPRFKVNDGIALVVALCAITLLMPL